MPDRIDCAWTTREAVFLVAVSECVATVSELATEVLSKPGLKSIDDLYGSIAWVIK